MCINANVLILNDDMSAENCFVDSEGNLDRLGRILNDDYQVSTKVRKLIKLGWVVHVGSTIKPSPLVKRFGGTWYENPDLMAVLGKKNILTHIGGGVYDFRPNPAYKPMSETQLNAAQKIHNSISEMEDYYTLANYRDGIVNVKPQPHEKDIGIVASNDYQYIYVPSRARGDKWLFTKVPEEKQYLSYKDFKANNIYWHSVRDSLASQNIKK